MVKALALANASVSASDDPQSLRAPAAESSVGNQLLWKSSSRTKNSKGIKKVKTPMNRLVDLDRKHLGDILSKAPKRFSADGNFSKIKSNSMITLPNGDGGYDSFMIYDSPVMHEKLAAKYPSIKSYFATGVENPKQKAYLTSTPLGFKAMILNPDRSTVLIEPVSTDLNTLSVYSSTELTSEPMLFEEAEIASTASQVTQQTSTESASRIGADDGKLRVYRFAISTNGEYTAYYGGSKELTLAGITHTLSRINGVLETDVGVRLDLVANNDAVIYSDPLTDPYDTTLPLADQVQATLDSVIGTSNYDLGHLLQGNSGGGDAGGIGSMCTSSKGRGRTGGSATSYDDYVFTEVLTHEIGHQLGATHTFSGPYGDSSAREVCVGSTIMSYAAASSTPTYQSHSDFYFHAGSIEQMTEAVKRVNCGTTILTNNSAPVVDAGPDYTIPKSTPFVLTGSAMDSDPSDTLTYNWEQMDFTTSTTARAVPSPTQTAGPAFRSYPPSSSPVRIFPNMKTVLAGLKITYTKPGIATSTPNEALSEVARTYNFRLTARDNRADGAANSSDDVVINVSSDAGPFAVTSQASLVGYQVGSTQAVTWTVAGTNANGINAQAVDILLSTDGGKTFPTTLASNVPNNGSASIVIPNIPGDKNRIMVKPRNHIFFDVNHANFSIYVTPDGIAPSAPSNLVATTPSTTITTLSWSPSTDNLGMVIYDVYRNGAVMASISQTSLMVSDLGPSTETFYVVARDAAANVSSASNSLSLVRGYSTTDSANPPPTAPVLSASKITSSSVVLSWSGATDNAGIKGFSVYQNGVLVKTTNMNSNTGITATFTTASNTVIAGLNPSQTYSFYAVAIDTNNALSPASNVVNVTTLAAIQESIAPTAPLLSASGTTSSSTLLSWSGATDNIGVVGYDLYQNGVLKTSIKGTSIALSGLSPSTNYSFTVFAKDAAKNKSAASNAVTVITPADTTLPRAPSVKVKSVDIGKVTLIWAGADDNVGVVGYEIYKNGAFVESLTPWSGLLTYGHSLSGLLCGTTLNFHIVAKDAAGNRSPPSNTVSATTLGTPNDTTPPTAPTLSLAASTSPGWTTFTWSGSTDNNVVTGYEIYRNGVIFGSGTTATSFPFSNTTSPSSYTVYVIAKDAAGNRSAASNTVSNTGTPSSGGDTTPPTTPTLSASGTTSSSTNLSWSGATDNVGVTGYDVYQNGVLKTSTTGTSLSTSGLSASTLYTFMVIAKDAAGNRSASSNAVSITTLAATPTADTTAPTAPVLTASGTTTSSTNLSWSGATDNVGVSGYDVYQNGVLKTSTTGTSLAVSGLSASTSYSFYVKAKDAAGNRSVSSNTVSVTTLAATPAADTTAPTAPALSASGVTSSSTNLYWSGATDAVGVTGYDIYQNGVLRNSSIGSNASITGLSASTTYNFYVIAKDAAGNRSAASNTVSVSTLAPISVGSSLTVTLTVPAAVARRSTVTFSATASVTSGAVSRVEFYVAGSLVCTDTTAAYSCSWKAPNAAKTVTVEARAFDSTGSQKSAFQTVQVTR